MAAPNKIPEATDTPAPLMVPEVAPKPDGYSREQECPRLAVPFVDHGRNFARLTPVVKPTYPPQERVG
jgi:hypothetical protein